MGNCSIFFLKINSFLVENLYLLMLILKSTFIVCIHLWKRDKSCKRAGNFSECLTDQPFLDDFCKFDCAMEPSKIETLISLTSREVESPLASFAFSSVWFQVREIQLLTDLLCWPVI